MSKSILSYCQISKTGVSLNGEMVHQFSEETLTENLKAYYKSLDLGYSKFYKMDSLSKLGFLGIEAMKQQNGHQLNQECDDIALILFNNDSSLDTDVKHQAAINKKTPSPAIFVYTLPNIVIGEISIRNKWYGESAFFVQAKPDVDFLLKQIKVLTRTQKAKKLVIGWLDCLEENFKCNLAFLDLNQEFDSKDALEKIIYN